MSASKLESHAIEGSHDQRDYLPSSQSKEPIWIEVSEIPPQTKNWDKLILPSHKFIRREPLSKEPISDFGRKRYSKRFY